jgi:hypothetical protein
LRRTPQVFVINQQEIEIAYPLLPEPFTKLLLLVGKALKSL